MGSNFMQLASRGIGSASRCKAVLRCMIRIRERYCFSLVCTSRKFVDFFEVKVDVQKGALRFRGKNDDNV
jgi:hypothetical protein